MARKPERLTQIADEPEEAIAPEAGDPDFSDPLPGVDPEMQEQRDRAQLDNAIELGGVNAELTYEREQQEQETIDALDALRALDHGEAIKWVISRTSHEDPDMNGYLETWPNSRMQLDRIRDAFGGGTYYLKGKRNGRYFVHKTISIAGDAIRKPRKSLMADQAQAHSQTFDVQGFLAQQDARDQARRREEEERRQREKKDRMELLTVLGPIMAPIIAAMVGKKDDSSLMTAMLQTLKPEKQNPLEMLQMLRELKAMEAPAQPAPDTIDRAFGLVDKLREMGGLGGGATEVGIWDIVKEAVKTMGPGIGQAVQTFAEQAAVAKAMDAQQRAQAAQRAQGTVPRQAPGISAASGQLALPHTIPPAIAPGSSPVAPSPGQAPVPAGTAASSFTSPITSEDDAMLKLLPLLPWLKGEVERLLIAAARKSDPELRATVMYDDLPDDADIESIGTVLSRSDWFQLFQSLDSRVANHPEFFSAVRLTLLALIEEDAGVSFGVRESAGRDASGREVVNVRGPGESGAAVSELAPSALSRQMPPRRGRNPNAPIERPPPLPPIAGDAPDTGGALEEGEE